MGEALRPDGISARKFVADLFVEDDLSSRNAKGHLTWPYYTFPTAHLQNVSRLILLLGFAILPFGSRPGCSVCS